MLMDFGVRLDFSYGRCTLVMEHSGDRVEYSAYRLHRSFEKLVGAVCRIAEGDESASCRWVSGELAGGVFLDLVADPGGGVNVAVHEFRHDETATTHEEIYSAVRGRNVWSTRVPRERFLLGFAAALRRVRVLYTDETGYLEHWGWLFPDPEYQRFMRIAQDVIYHPESTSEIRRIG